MVRNRGAATLTLENRSAPFQLVVKQVRSVPVTASEWYDGYDTKLEVELDHTGNPPKWWNQDSSGYSSNEDGTLGYGPRNLPLQRRPRVEHPHRTKGVWHAYYLMRCSDIPANLGQVRLQHRLCVINNVSKPVTRPVSIDLVVRKAGQVIPKPMVDMQSPIRLLKQVVTAGRPNENTDPARDAVSIQLWYQDSKTVSRQIRFKVLTSSGRELPQGYCREEPFGSWTYSNEVRTWGVDIELSPYKDVPGELKALCQINAGDAWPLEVIVPIRKADGTVPATPRTAPKFRIASVSVRQPTAVEVTTYKSTKVVDVEIVPQGLSAQEQKLPLVAEPIWDEAVWSDSGEPFDQDVSGNNTGIEMSTQVEGDGTDSSLTISYQLNLTRVKLPPSRLVLRGSIAVNGSRRVPFQAVVREAVAAQGAKVPAPPFRPGA